MIYFFRWVLIGIMALVLVAALAWQGMTQSRLKQEVAVMREAHEEHLRLQERTRLQARSQVDGQEFQRLKNEHEELVRLRGELAALGPEKAVQKTKSQLPPAKPLLPGMFAVGELGNPGQAMPAEALKSFFSGIAKADPAALSKLLIFDAEARTKADAFFQSLDEDLRQTAGSPEFLCALYYQSLFSRVTGIQDLGQAYQESGAATTRLRLQTRIGKVHEMGFKTKQENGVWKIVVAPGVVQATARIISAGELGL